MVRHFKDKLVLYLQHTSIELNSLGLVTKLSILSICNKRDVNCVHGVHVRMYVCMYVGVLFCTVAKLLC